ncbi:glutaredoxin 3 [Prochlorococcus marinus]|uniref:glutaredoxin 3 n=1 Tax=Prochlorococcus marinus TaxID=1219 RepID=UPI0022B2CF2B|nr:glutaredoxin 3 [Prochlorococcus marinus]
MAKVEIYTWQYCPFCIRAKALLDSKGIQYEELPIDGNQEARQKMTERASGRTTVPQIFINNQGIGGCDELYSLEGSNELDALIEQHQ